MTQMERKIQHLEQQIKGISSNFVSLLICLINKIFDKGVVEPIGTSSVQKCSCLYIRGSVSGFSATLYEFLQRTVSTRY